MYCFNYARGYIDKCNNFSLQTETQKQPTFLLIREKLIVQKYNTHANWWKKFCPLNQATVLYNSFVSFTSHLRRIGYADFQLRKFNKKIKSILWSPVQF